MLKVKLGPAGIPILCEKRDTVSGIERVSELGLQAMEVEFVHGIKMSKKTARMVGEAAKEYGISLSIHAPYFINLCSEDKDKIKASIKRILDSCILGEEMGANIVVFHPGYYQKLSRNEAFEMVLESCQNMSDYLSDHGMKILLGAETMGKHSAFGSLDENIKLGKKVKKLVPVIDFAHLYARNYGKINYPEILDKVKHLKHLHTHFSNIEYNMAGERRHLPLDGRPKFRPLAEEILKRKLDITIICESPLLERDSLKMKKVFESLGYSFSK